MVILSNNHASTHTTRFIMPIPFPPTKRLIIIKIDILRLHRSKSDHFYIISQHRDNCKRPTLLIVGSTGNIYTITIHPSVNTCSCPDFFTQYQILCKHILFMLHRLNSLPLNINCFVQRFSYSTIAHHFYKNYSQCFRKYELDRHTNQLCLSYKSHCIICHESFTDSFRVCARCACPIHPNCLRCSLLASNQCPSCGRDWVDNSVQFQDGYFNVYHLLTQFRYKINNNVKQVNSEKKKEKSTKRSRS